MELKKNQVFEIFVYPQEVDCTKQATLTAMGNYLLNVAGLAAEEKGFGMDVMHDHDLAWVMSRLALEMYEYPTQYEKIYIETWVEDYGKLITTRNFKIMNVDGKVIGLSSSLWAAISMQTRRPVNLLNLPGLSDFAIGVSVNIEKPKRIDELKEGFMWDYTIKYSDIDINRHTNSMKYVQWMLDTYPVSHFEEKKIARFDVNYVHEALGGEMVKIFKQEENDCSFFEVKSQEGLSLCKVAVEWK